MMIRTKFWQIALMVASGLAATAVAQAQEEPVVSPFSSPQTSPDVSGAVVEPPSALDSFEFNGIVQMGGVLRVSVYDAKADKNYWIRIDESTADGLRVQRYDEKTQTVVLARGGVSKRLTFKEARIEPLKIAAAPPPATVSAIAAPSQGATGGPQVAQETDEEVRERMQRVAEEIRRRRAERRQRLENAQ